MILNRCASARHERLARLGMDQAGINVLGVLPRRGDLTLPERHLGLIQAVEHPDLEQAIQGYAAFLRAHVDLNAIKAAARAGPTTTGALPKPPAQRIALAQDAAFSFTYPHILTGWRNAGAEILPFSPLADTPPAVDADLVWLPGGYPELHAGRLAANTAYLNGLRPHAPSKPVHSEYAGNTAQREALVDKEGTRHQMAGLLGLVTSYEKRKFHLGYRQATLQAPMPGFGQGACLRGHEFHYSTILEEPDAPLAQVGDADGNRRVEAFHWGLIPSWAKDRKIASKMINARSETVADRPSFRDAYRFRRCLVVADGFYEWQPAGARKQPYWIRLDTEAPFAFAGTLHGVDIVMPRRPSKEDVAATATSEMSRQ